MLKISRTTIKRAVETTVLNSNKKREDLSLFWKKNDVKFVPHCTNVWQTVKFRDFAALYLR